MNVFIFGIYFCHNFHDEYYFSLIIFSFLLFLTFHIADIFLCTPFLGLYNCQYIFCLSVCIFVSFLTLSSLSLPWTACPFSPTERVEGCCRRVERISFLGSIFKEITFVQYLFQQSIS